MRSLEYYVTAEELILSHIETVGVFEFTKEVLAVVGAISLLWLFIKLFFCLYGWGQPSPTSFPPKER